MREEIFQYVKKKYKVEPDYPFSTAPTYPVLRHIFHGAHLSGAAA